MSERGKKNKIQKRYDTPSYIAIYDRRYHEGQFSKFEILQPHLSPLEGNLLDNGAGTGLFWDFIHQNNEKVNMNYRFIAIDISYGMLKKFCEKSRCKTSYPYERPELICGDGENLPFRNRQFQRVVAFTSLQNLSNIDLGVQEISRVSMQKSKIGVSFLKKSLTEVEFIELMRKKFPNTQKIHIEFDFINNSEDWYSISKKDNFIE